MDFETSNPPCAFRAFTAHCSWNHAPEFESTFASMKLMFSSPHYRNKDFAVTNVSFPTCSKSMARFAVILLCMLPLLLSLHSQGKSGHQRRQQNQQHIVLIHGVGHGAWCWYKVVALLQREGYKAVALDLMSAGKNRDYEAGQITTLALYSKPLLDYLDQVDEHKEAVTLVGHSMAGCVLTYAMEKYPSKIAKAVFIASFTPRNNQSYLSSAFPEVFPRLGEKGLSVLHFGEDATNNSKPIAYSFNLDLVKQFIYNESPEEDVVLAKSLIAAGPYQVAEEVLTLSEHGYDRVRRFYIMTVRDELFLAKHQELSVAFNPPEAVFRLECSDHSPFFSFPLQLSNLLIHISTL